MFEIPHLIEFNKEVWSKNIKSIAREQRFTNEHLRWLFGCCEKTLGRYLNPERPELPKIPKMVRAFQGLNTSPGHLLIDRGPRLIDPKSAMGLFSTMERMADTSRPALRITMYHVTDMDDKKLRKVNKFLERLNQRSEEEQNHILEGAIKMLPDNRAAKSPNSATES